MTTQVVVIIGTGGIGQAIGRRQGAGRTVLLTDRNENTLVVAAQQLEAGGHTVITAPVEVSSRASVHELAQKEDEMSGPGAEGYQNMIAQSAAGRVGTTDEIATAAAFLLGHDGAFITGADLLIDGGVIAAIRAGRIQLSL